VFLRRRRGARSARDHGDGIAKTNAPKPHLSGQPGGRHVNVPPDKPKAKAGGLRERVRPGAQKNYDSFFREVRRKYSSSLRSA